MKRKRLRPRPAIDRWPIINEVMRVRCHHPPLQRLRAPTRSFALTRATWFLSLLAVTVAGCSPTATPGTAAERVEPSPVSSSSSISTPPRASPSASPVYLAQAPDAASAPAIRVAWTQDLGDGIDIFSFGEELTLMGFDSRDGRGERVILREPGSYAKPLITPSGDEIVFSMRRQGAVYAVRWDGSGLRRVADGFGLAVWSEPVTGHEWVYVGSEPVPTDPPSYRAVRRYRINEPARNELVWDAQPVSNDSFQVSADGRYAGALFPWPDAGVADLARGTWERLGHGCWTAIANDDSHVGLVLRRAAQEPHAGRCRRRPAMDGEHQRCARDRRLRGIPPALDERPAVPHPDRSVHGRRRRQQDLRWWPTGGGVRGQVQRRLHFGRALDPRSRETTSPTSTPMPGSNRAAGRRMLSRRSRPP